MTIDGIDIKARYGMVLVDSMELNPPAPKRVTIDIPGGDGVIDLTEAFGDVAYSNREQAFEFDVDGDIEAIKTEVSKAFHGRRLEYTVPGDEGFTYTGRWSVESYTKRRPGRVRIRLAVSADPYKSAGLRTENVDAQAGTVVHASPGRGRVKPVFTSTMPIHVICNGIDAHLPAGTYTAVGLFIRDGESDIYVNTGGFVRGGNTRWSDVSSKTWGDVKDKKWYELMWANGKPKDNKAYHVHIQYEVKEL